MPTEPSPAPLRGRLRTGLRDAMKAGDRKAVAALRSTLAAIDNAEAVPGTSAARLAIEESPVGVGAAEAERLTLTDAQVEAIVRAELAERETAADGYRRAGRHERAALLLAEAAVLAAHLSEPA